MSNTQIIASASESISQKPLINFAVFPKHIGVWSSRWIRMDANAQEIARFEAIITQKIVDNQWVQSNSYKYADGTTATHNFVGTVISDDEVELEAVDQPAWQDYNTIAREHGDGIIIFNIWDKANGKLFATETINLVNHTNRCRTGQSFTADGKLKGLTLIVEERIS
jgi:hypothetical protein